MVLYTICQGQYLESEGIRVNAAQDKGAAHKPKLTTNAVVTYKFRNRRLNSP